MKEENDSNDSTMNQYLISQNPSLATKPKNL